MKNKFKFLIGVIVVICIFTQCIKNDTNPPQKNEDSTDSKFDFATTKLCQLNVNYNTSDYSIFVEVYDQNPMKEVTFKENGVTYSSLVKIEGLKSIFCAITDKSGVFNEYMDIDLAINKIYLYTEYIGVPSVIEANLTPSGFNVNLNENRAKYQGTKADGLNEMVYPENMSILGSWDAYGLPNYLMPTRMAHPKGLLNDISYIIKYTPATVKSPLFDVLGDKFETNINLTKATPLKLVFANESASMKNTIGYYCYPTGQKPSNASEIKIIIALPNASYPGAPGGGNMSSGDQIKLKYLNENGAFQDEFPANTTIGFVLLPSSFRDDASISVYKTYYSNQEFNTTEAKEEARQHCIALYDNENDLVVYAFEDAERGKDMTSLFPGGNFADVIFYIKTDVAKSYISKNIAPLKKSEIDEPEYSKNTLIYEGIVAYEDLWPYEGDYDMNDVVMEYSCTLYRNKTNNVIKSVDKFTLRNNGGAIPCGFAYQRDIDKASVEETIITPVLGSYSSIKSDIKGFELGNTDAVVMLFDNVLNVPINTEFIVETKYSASSKIKYQDIIPPYNPFIIINSDKGRGKELHLTNLKPTALADLKILGTGNDASNAKKKIFYVSTNNTYPFAIKIPDTGFIFPNERIRIDIAYPDFKEWVKSNGHTNGNWWKPINKH